MLHRIFLSAWLLCFAVSFAHGQEGRRPNVLIITVDDMSADSLGAFGCKLDDTSPNVDAFARAALRFNHAHVQVGNCMPGRNIMWSGMFSHANGVEGFVQNPDADYPVLCDLAQQAGYFAAIRGKASHSTPYHPYGWDAVLDADSNGKKFHTKNAKGYGESTRNGIAMAKDAGKPFCLLVNISDPHKPFYAQAKNGETIDDEHVPTRVFSGDEVPVPGFLPDDKVIRKELAHYYSSVRRADDCFGEVIKAVDESGQADNTFVLFFSDHGMPLPFAKTQLYHHSTHTPMIVRWPSVTKPGSIDNKHMVSAVDLIPTLMDVMQHEHPTPARLHGRSFAPVIRGEEQDDRDFVILQYNENSGRARHPMRGIQTREHLYLYNPWSNGERKFATATTGTMTYRQMVKRADKEAGVAARLQLFDHRVLEELYDVRNDADCLTNLVADTDQRSTVIAMRQQLAQSLKAMGDPVAPLVAAFEDDALREKYMAAEDERSKRARENRQKKASPKGAGQNKKTGRRPLRDAISFDLPRSISAGGECRVLIRHKIPKELNEQKVQVTLKKLPSGAEKSAKEQRIERKVISVAGDGQVSVSFRIPETLVGNVRFAAFVGESYTDNLAHIQSKTIAVK